MQKLRGGAACEHLQFGLERERVLAPVRRYGGRTRAEQWLTSAGSPAASANGPLFQGGDAGVWSISRTMRR
jgi:hypothetical protein